MAGSSEFRRNGILVRNHPTSHQSSVGTKYGFNSQRIRVNVLALVFHIFRPYWDLICCYSLFTDISSLK